MAFRVADDAVLTINAGSSSIKLAVFGPNEGETPGVSALVERIGGPDAAARIDRAGGARSAVDLSGGAGDDHAGALAAVLPRLAEAAGRPIGAAGHRIVHGGDA
ncbi:MAG: hypothetical protein AAFU61_13805, partial [Pseudomonadota bacterium]